ncbi:DUF2199 domain-containing protein [Phragmitibacter flavus]|nr:DUF2199 domain-containing protein [Phragmitibacter flavus]
MLIFLGWVAMVMFMGSRKNKKIDGFSCKECGRVHAFGSMDMAFHRPSAYFDVPEEERASRCKESDDLCRIDGERHFIRGMALISIVDLDDTFAWGMWAEVSKEDFNGYLRAYSVDGSLLPRFPGRLSVEDFGYRGLEGHEVAIQLGKSSERPEFYLTPSDHAFYRDQIQGITYHRSREILHAMDGRHPDPNKD